MGTQAVSWASPRTFNTFDTTLGTLTGITVNLTSRVDGSLTVFNGNESDSGVSSYGLSGTVRFTNIPSLATQTVTAISQNNTPFTLSVGESCRYPSVSHL